MTYRSSSITTGDSVASMDPGKPAGFASTDILVAVATVQIPTGNRPIVAPSGWTLVRQTALQATNGQIAIFWALGSVASTEFAPTAANFGGRMEIHAFTGRHQTTPITASGDSLASGSSLAMVAPALTAASQDDLLIVWMDAQSAVAFGTTTAGTTEISAGTYSASGLYSSCSYKEAVSAGTTGTFSRDSGTGTEFNERFSATVALAGPGSSAAPQLGRCIYITA